jgi:hypothetical protein
MSGIGINLVNGSITGRASGAVFGRIGAVTGRITCVLKRHRYVMGRRDRISARLFR